MRQRLQQWALWPATAVLVALAALSIAGAFPQVDAPRLFNSTPLIAFWCALLAMLVAGPLLLRRLRTPAAMAMHLGAAMVLVGAMWGSHTAHDLLGRSGPRRGYLLLREGDAASVLKDASNQPIGAMSFTVMLNDFWSEYPPVGGPWLLGLQLPGDGGEQGEPIWPDWQVGQTLELPDVPGSIKVLDYLPRARGAYEKGHGPTLEIIPYAGEAVVIPAEVGQEASVGTPAVTVRIVRKFDTLVVRNPGPNQWLADLRGPARNPALAVSLDQPDGTAHTRFVMAHLPGHGGDAPRMVYHLPPYTHAVADSASNAAAMKVQITAPDGTGETRWLIPAPQSDHAMIPAPLLLGRATTAPRESSSPVLVLLRPLDTMPDYRSELVLLDEGRPAAQGVIRVNRPLHYDGYHLYQHAAFGEDASILHAVSDAGLAWVWTGLTVMTAGTFWALWIAPVVARLQRRRGATPSAPANTQKGPSGP